MKKLIASIVALVAAVANAQQAQNSPRIGYVYPAGGKQGTTFELKLGGQALDGIDAAHVSGKGVTAKLVDYIKPISQGQAGLLREKLKELADKQSAAMKDKSAPPYTADDEKAAADIRKKLADFLRKPNSPALVETVTLEVTIDSAAAVGARELRLETPNGMTNPMVFQVGALTEFAEKESRASAAADVVEITLPSAVNGQIMPGDVDRYRFKATKGQKLVVQAQARELIPYLADAVPGWFQAVITVYDAKGLEVAYGDDFRFNPDPVLYYEVPSDGNYVVEIRDSIYRGREDFVYRITIGELPFITGVYPLGAKVGGETTVELSGWNLPSNKLTVNTKEAGVQYLSVRNAQGISNRVPFAVDATGDVPEQEPNDSIAKAQVLTLPTIVNGRIDRPGDWDVYRIDARVGSELVVDVEARRLGSPIDSVVRLTDAAGKQLAFNDDSEDKGMGLSTHHADSLVRFSVPATGAYYLHIGDTQNQGGKEFTYRLRVGPPRPDFELRMAPSGINVRAGASVPVTVQVVRKDGFAGEVNVSLKDAPAGFVLSGSKIPAGQDKVRMTLTAPPAATKEAVALSLTGKAMIAGKEVTRPVVPSEDMMQAFFYRHMVPAQELMVSVSGRWATKNVIKVVSPTPVRIPVGGTARVVVSTPSGAFFGKTVLELSEAPEGISIKSMNPVREGTEIVLECAYGKVKPGTKGNLIINAFVERGEKKRTLLGVIPAVAFEVISR